MSVARRVGEVQVESGSSCDSSGAAVSHDDSSVNENLTLASTDSLPTEARHRPGAYQVALYDEDDVATVVTPTVAEETAVQTANDTSLELPVVAQLVNPDEENQILEQRLQDELQAQYERAPVAQIVKSRWNRKRIICAIGSGLLVMVAVILAIALTLARPESSNDGDSPRGPPPPKIVELLSPVSYDGRAALMNDATPQNAAAWWLSRNKYINWYSYEQKIQRYALATLYYSTNGRRWKSKKDWLGELDECKWSNIGCVDNRSVSSLLLEENELNGTVPMDLALLESLDQLRLTDNPALKGNIPTTLGALTNLTLLSLKANNITSSLPTSLGLLTKLTRLELEGNRLIGNIITELGRLTNLTYFQISANQLNGRIPTGTSPK